MTKILNSAQKMMRKWFSSVVCVAFLIPLVGEAVAGPPKKPNVRHYARLWQPSPFTVKPKVKPPETITPLERDWMLANIRPGVDGYSVTLVNKKDRKQKVRFLPGLDSGEFKLLQVKQDTSSYKKSRVQIKKGNQTAWIGYDEKLLKAGRAANAGKRRTPIQRKRLTNNNNRTTPPIPGQMNKKNQGNNNKSRRVRHVPRRR